MVNIALQQLDGLLERMYEPKPQGWLTKQVQYNLLFHMVHPVVDGRYRVGAEAGFTKNRKRLIEYDVVVALFNEIIAIADAKGWLSGKHFSVDCTLFQTQVGRKI